MSNLPQNYSYAYTGFHGVGTQAFAYFLQISHLSPMYWETFNFEDVKTGLDNFLKNYSQFFNQNKTYGISLCQNYDKTITKDLALLTHKVPHFILLRDPISIAKTFINQKMANYITRSVFRSDLHEPSFKELMDLMALNNFAMTYGFCSSPDQIKNATKEKHYFDMSDLVGKNAFFTMQKIIDILGSGDLLPPNAYDLTFNSVLERFMPSYPVVNLNNGKSFKILIGTRASFYRYSRYFCSLDQQYKNAIIFENFIHPKRKELKLYVVLHSGDISLEQIKKSPYILDLIRQKIDIFVDKSYEIENLAKQKRLNEEDIIDLIKELKYQEIFKNIFAKEVEPLRKTIDLQIGKWNYYNKFMELT